MNMTKKESSQFEKKRILTIWFLPTQVEKVLQYNYTTAEKSTDKMVEESGIFGSMMEAVNRTSSGPMHGFGVRFPPFSNLCLIFFQGGASLQCRLQRLPWRAADNPEHAGGRKMF